jgi:hypothetical protein
MIFHLFCVQSNQYETKGAFTVQAQADDVSRCVTWSADVIFQVDLQCDVTVTRVYVEGSATSHVKISELGRVELQRRFSRVKS